MERVAIYLRKSRADMEAEARGEGETLAKHKRALLEFAKENGLNIIKIYEEVASGESLIHRPEMLSLLREVEEGKYDGVLCMDMDRLGRGNMREQGIILDSFRESNTRIITPRKTYDLTDEFDEEYSEFETFMARRELKLINRRLQRGRIASVKEGRYLGTVPPYGYEKAVIGGHKTLVPHPEQAQVVKMIFEWYTDLSKNMGSNNIAKQLTEMGIPSYAGKERWDASTVRSILSNPVYIGKIKWRHKERKKVPGPDSQTVTRTRTRPRSEWIITEGRHEPLVDEERFAQAQSILASRNHAPAKSNKLNNPLAGIVRCRLCEGPMTLRPYRQQRPPHLICINTYCKNKSSRFELVERRLLDCMSDWLKEYKAQWDKKKQGEYTGYAETAARTALQKLVDELSALEKQKLRIHDLLERGIYDEGTYLERSQDIAKRILETKNAISTAEQVLAEEIKRQRAQEEIIPKVEHVLSLYHMTSDVNKKNALLKSVISRALYFEDKAWKGDHFELEIQPLLPQYPD